MCLVLMFYVIAKQGRAFMLRIVELRSTHATSLRVPKDGHRASMPRTAFPLSELGMSPLMATECSRSVSNSMALLKYRLKFLTALLSMLSVPRN